MKWVQGRQGTGYEKLKLFQFLFFDCYLLRYKVGDSIPWHTDPIPNRKHLRLNIELKKAKVGGTLFLANAKNHSDVTKASRFTLFRSDIQPHMVTKILEGNRWVLTFGVAL